MKISIRFFNDQEVRAIWDDEHSQWRFSVLDIVGVLNEEPNYTKTRNYWKYLKAKLKKQNSQLVSTTTQLKLTATEDKKYSKTTFPLSSSQTQYPRRLLCVPIQKRHPRHQPDCCY
jgi:cell filamentation protein